MTRFKHQNVIFYAVTIAAVCTGLFLWVNQGDDTNQKATDTNATVEAVQKAVDDLQADHDGQDALLTCLFNYLAEKQVVTKVEIEGCVISTAVPTKTSSGTEPAGQTTSPAQSSDSPVSSSSNKSITPPVSQQPDSSPPENPPPNDGITIPLPDIIPLLPDEIHIPSIL